MTVSPQLLEILVCPRCKGRLDNRPDAELLACQACGVGYPVRDGIPIMLSDEAKPLDP